MTTTTLPETEATQNGKLESNLKRGVYKLVGWDMDTTGKKPSDEICQIAGYTPDDQYSQYVMPYKDLSVSAKARYALRVVTISKYRMLKDTQTNKIIKSKSEIYALKEFIDWLQMVKDKADNVDGIILIFHESRQVLPSILLESLKKYDQLYDQFTAIVKGFVNTFDVAEAHGKGTNNSFSMRTLTRNFFNKDIEDGGLAYASVRAKLALEIIEHYIKHSNENVSEPKTVAQIDATAIYEYVHSYVQTIKEEENISAELKAVAQRESTLAPIFATFLRTPRQRQQVTPLRRLLAEAKIEYAQLEETWKSEKMEGVEKLINGKIKDSSEKKMEHLLLILECHFDEEKAESLRARLEKKPRIPRKKKQRAVKKLDSTNNDSGNDSADNTLTHSPIKNEVTDSNENKIEVVV